MTRTTRSKPLVDALLEAADEMEHAGILDATAHQKITLRVKVST